MKLATWNVNSLRARMGRVLEWIRAESPDVLCLQETKVEDRAFPWEPLEDLGYQGVVHGQKTYNGVAILSRGPGEDVVKGTGEEAMDEQARLVAATVDGVRVMSVYVPNGSEVGSEKYGYKLRWFKAFEERVARELAGGVPLAVCGDFNVAPEDRDVHDPEAWRGRVLFSDPERKALAGLLDLGLSDALRCVTGEGGLYTWWDYRQGAFHRGFGLRIDHILLSSALVGGLKEVRIDREARKGKGASDHAPVVAVLGEGPAS